MSAITDALNRWGALSSPELYRAVADNFGSKRSFERALSDTPHLLRFGHQTNRAYALHRPGMPPVPMYLRDEQGNDVRVGEIRALAAGQWALDSPGDIQGWMLLGQLAEASNVFQGLPWFLDQFRPAGFLGRTWVREHAVKRGWSLDVTSWTDDRVLTAALQQPWDWRGNLSIGPFVETPDHVVASKVRRDVYAKRADQVLQGMIVGASADGEQPKFTAMVDEGHVQRPVIVKFSQRITNDLAARRWADVMVTEAVASQVMTLHGMRAASTEVWRHDDRLWLETTRFDRVGAAGRRGMAALGTLAQAFNFNGPRGGWVEAVRHLHSHGVVSAEEVAKGERLATISNLLSNNDMHMGNLSFMLPSGKRVSQLEMAPVYDMTPMRWIPSLTTGAVPPLDFQEPLYRTEDAEALTIAMEVWAEASCHSLISEEWASWAADRAARIGRVLESLQSPPRGPSRDL